MWSSSGSEAARACSGMASSGCRGQTQAPQLVRLHSKKWCVARDLQRCERVPQEQALVPGEPALPPGCYGGLPLKDNYISYIYIAIELYI